MSGHLATMRSRAAELSALPRNSHRRHSRRRAWWRKLKDPNSMWRKLNLKSFSEKDERADFVGEISDIFNNSALTSRCWWSRRWDRITTLFTPITFWHVWISLVAFVGWSRRSSAIIKFLHQRCADVRGLQPSARCHGCEHAEEHRDDNERMAKVLRGSEQKETSQCHLARVFSYETRQLWWVMSRQITRLVEWQLIL